MPPCLNNFYICRVFVNTEGAARYSRLGVLIKSISPESQGKLKYENSLTSTKGNESSAARNRDLRDTEVWCRAWDQSLQEYE